MGFSEDILTPVTVQPALYQHLLGRPGGQLYRQINAADAVHSMYIVNPNGFLDQLLDIGNLI